MAQLHLHSSNRLELLAARLAEVLASPLASPLSPEIIVVQSKGMETWLRMELARHLGISANLVFPFPNRIVAQLFYQVIQLEEDQDFLRPQGLTWKVMEALDSLLDRPEFRDIRDYLQGPPRESKLYQLSARIAQVFDHYLVFRPHMVLAWERGEGNHWQAILWRDLVGQRRVLHKARLKQLFMESHAQGGFESSDLPQRISLFGISSLPPYHMEILGAVAQVVEVNLFLLNPCKEYWGDIIPQRRLSALKREAKDKGLDPHGMHLEAGNRLLASMGKLGRDFQEIILDMDPVEHHYFVENTSGTLLAHIQNQILNLTEPGEDNKVELLDHDRSIEVHSCHSPLREMEVLKDHLLEMFQGIPDLLPKDIVVMTPDIHAYTPYIQAVFGTQEEGPRKIPFTIADRSLGQEGQVGLTLLKILALPQSRFRASQVLDILEARPVRNRYQISEEDLSLIRNWVSESGIRWGIDDTQKEREGLPPVRENTWFFGLDRLLLGYALPEKGKLFKEILPYEKAGILSPELLGKFSAFLNNLFDHLQDLEEKRGLAQWGHKLGLILEDLMAPDEETSLEYERVHGILEELSLFEDQGFKQAVGIEIALQFLKEELEGQGLGLGFLAGGVTFCALLPMRSIPFRVVCLVGMNYDSFPRQAKPLQFDLMAQNPRRGDRSKRDDDRYLFLEAILSARDKLYISYVGQSQEDNSTIPPSALVSELIDYIQDCFVKGGKGSCPDVVVVHRLQAFSPAYFSGHSRLFSYSQEDLQGAKALTGPQIEQPFTPKELPLPSETMEISLEEFTAFFKNPAKHFLRRCLKIRLPALEDMVKDQEPLSFEGLEAYQLDQFLGKHLASGWSNSKGIDERLKELCSLARAQGILPHGPPGQAELVRRSADVELYLRQLDARRAKPALDPLELELNLHSGLKVRGRIENIYPSFLLTHRLGRIRAKDKIAAWIEHLLLNLVAPPQYPRDTLLMGKRESFRLREVKNAHEVLQELSELFLHGLRRPLIFFPETSLCYAEKMAKGKGHNGALSSARDKWLGGEWHRGEGEDEYFKICFGKEAPLGEEFSQISLKIWRPLLQSIEGL